MWRGRPRRVSGLRRPPYTTLVSGDGMADKQREDWRKVYRAAMLETNAEKFRERAAEAQKVIVERLRELTPAIFRRLLFVPRRPVLETFPHWFPASRPGRLFSNLLAAYQPFRHLRQGWCRAGALARLRDAGVRAT